VRSKNTSANQGDTGCKGYSQHFRAEGLVWVSCCYKPRLALQQPFKEASI